MPIPKRTNPVIRVRMPTTVIRSVFFFNLCRKRENPEYGKEMNRVPEMMEYNPYAIIREVGKLTVIHQ
jgi:hypothetical protein